MKLTYKSGDVNYTINEQFQLFNEQEKKFVETKLSLVRSLLKGDGYMKCVTLQDYKRSFTALHFTPDIEEETKMKPIRKGKRK